MYGHAFDAFRLIMSDKEAVYKELELTEDEQRILFESISRKMAPTAMKLRAEFELTCFTYEGIDALKEALITARTKVNAVDPKIVVSFKLIAPPLYRCETTTLKKVEGLALLEDALKTVESTIKAKGGTFKVVNKPQIIGDSAKDKDLEDIMKMPGERESDEDGSSAEEDNEEGMGEVDLGDGFDEEDNDGEEKKVAPKKKAKKGAASDDEDDDV
jgi:translation initiation factor 2 subunit 1